jgi:hypothetical protein
MFNHTVMLLIVCNCVALMFEDPVCKCSGTSASEAERYPGYVPCTEADLFLQLLYSYEASCIMRVGATVCGCECECE